MVGEALGLSLPHSALAPSGQPVWRDLAVQSARALMELDAIVLDPQTINDTLGVLLKYQDDIVRMRGSEAARLLEQVRNEARTAGN